VPHDDGAEVREAAKLAAAAGVAHVAVTEPVDWGAAVDALLAAHGGPIGGRWPGRGGVELSLRPETR